MTPLHKAAQMALDALDAITDDVDGTGLNTMPSFDKALDAIATLREALNAPEPEPVAEVFDTFGNSQDPNKAVGHVWLKAHYFPPKGAKLYAAPPAAPAPAAPVVPLTDGQIRQIVRDTFDVVPLPHDITFARAIEAAHGITGASK